MSSPMNSTVDVVPSPYTVTRFFPLSYRNVILSSCSSGNKRRGRVLNLHFMEQHVAILCEFDLTRAVDQHLQGSLRTYAIISSQ